MIILYGCVCLRYGLPFVRLSPCRRKLIEARRIEAEYDAAKGRYDQALEISQAVLETWGRVETMQTQEVRLLLKQGLGRISQKACGLISQTIAKALMDCGVPLQDMAVTQSAVSGKRGVRVLQYPGWATDTERVVRSCSLLSNLGVEISVINYKKPLLRKVE